MPRARYAAVLMTILVVGAAHASGQEIEVREDDEQIRISTPHLEAAIRKRGYVSGVARESFLDKKTGFHDAGFGLDIVDWIMEPGSDEAYRDQLDPELVYRFDNAYHGRRPKRSIEGPQICTRARQLDPQLIRGQDFIAVKQQFQYRTAAPQRNTGSTWTQYLVFPHDTRYFLSMDRIDAVNSSEAMFLRIDMPGHIRHQGGDTFSQIYLSYLDQTNDAGGFAGGLIPAAAFLEDFPPDARFNYQRERVKQLPQRIIRAYQLRDPETGELGPWLAGMTLDPAVVYEAWCHQRGYVCMIQEFGGRPVKAGESFSAAFVVGFFDSLDEMHQVYDRYKGHTALQVSADGWQLR